MLSSQGIFETENASKYIQQLCKHFAHKVSVEYTETEGRADLPPGPAVMVARPDALVVDLSAQDAEGLELAKHIIDNHLERFAFREDFKSMNWQDKTSL